MAAAVASRYLHAPSSESLGHRALIAVKIRGLRDLTPRVPFWKLSAHRVPTLWTLYRGLLRNSPAEVVSDRIRGQFWRYRHLTSPADTKNKLLKFHRWLDIFVKAKQGDQQSWDLLRRYARMLEVRKQKDKFAQMLCDDMMWEYRTRPRPRVTGSILRASLYNKPMPRLKPQPINITGILVSRHHKRAVRQAQLDNLLELKRDIRREYDFEKALEHNENLQFPKVMSQSAQDLLGHLQSRIDTINEAFDRDNERLMSPHTPELLEKNVEKFFRLPFAARGNGRRPHILVKMTAEEKRMDTIARSSVSEVGYIGYVKKKLGWKLRNPNAWKVEEGVPEHRKELRRAQRRIDRVNRRRRLATDTDLELEGGGNMKAKSDVD
ncbi:hypothetical protein NM688_g4914 [Phlebia brevispora]|uniref:Uncharacterized protein n=1 Tax=Phlebia brevispora TaxID=194682 RepID=A0ACC1T1K2_9APHY|nr:hypothetical protein NM688_g4914 [Phlebia brevispora]